MLNTCPAAVIVPVRAAPVLAATVNCTGPGPVWFGGGVMAIHGVAVVAVQVHEAAVLTVKDPDPPADGVVWLVAESAEVQPLA